MPKIAIVGTGLIGTSLALALRNSSLLDLQLVGTDSSGGARSGAQKSGAFDHMENRLLNAVEGADIVVLATPIIAMKELLEVLASNLPEGCVVTDVGSSKQTVLEWADQYLPENVHFVGGHPMAGRETAGPENADPNLFRGSTYCVIPSAKASERAAAEITTMVEAIEATPYYISAGEHDSFVAAVSHLPFLLSVALVGCTSESPNWDDIARVASSGYHDLTRLASGDTVMHRDICVTNPEPIVAWIDSFIRELYKVRQLLGDSENLDQSAILDLFVKARDERNRWLAGEFGPQARQYNPHTELPTFAQSMGDMFVGRRLQDVQRRLFRGGRDEDRRR
ncbi:MAG: prephenate dehydrogenase/arogenate dehydrogenase family protein [Chloroflexi bacterium]|nr:prephenate dehydrogenase/arogenate dehydrogenase family protein [Chloroflexota bacterium]